MRDLNERGIAMITTLLVLMLMSALLVGFTAVVMSDQRYRFIDHDRGQAYYAASGGIEKLTSDLGNLFFSHLAPTAAQLTALTSSTSLPGITGITYSALAAPTPLPASFLAPFYCGPAPLTAATVGTMGYTIMFCSDATGNPVATSSLPVQAGPYAGLIALQTPYQLDVTARTTTAGEVHLIRTMNSVAIPVFQFGTFSDVDLAFFAGPNFNFGGRVHTNGSLFLAEGNGSTLTLGGKVTAVNEVVTQQLQNGVSINTAPAHAGTVSIATSSTGFRTLDPTEGSVVGGVGSALNDPTWQTISLSTYNSNIRNGRTGATALNLPLLTVGGTNPDLLRRPCQVGAATVTLTVAPFYPGPCPAVGEDVSNPVLFNERLFTKASLRILLSDTAADITNLPTVTATAPVSLENWNGVAPNNGTAYGPIDATHPPIATSPGYAAGVYTMTTNGNTPNVTPTEIKVVALPAFFKVPATMVLGVNILNKAVACTRRTATSFTGCTVGATVANGSTVTGATALGVGEVFSGAGVITVTTTTTGASTPAGAGANRTVPVVSTAAFAPTTFWLGGVVVSCSGYDSTVPKLTGCGNVPATNSPQTITTNALSNAGTGTIGGFIKIERQDATNVWNDVTMEILNNGIAGPNLGGAACTDPTPNAILRIQRLKDNGGTCDYAAPAPGVTGTINSNDWWPNTLFDTREGLTRDTNPGNTNILLGGLMHYIAIDVGNLAQWFTATGAYTAGTGASSRTDNGGFTVYFSDRRNNRNAANLETAEYGWEDFVNPLNANGAPNGTLDTGEDLNGNGVLDTYGSLPNYNAVSGAVPPGAAAPLLATAGPATTLTQGQAQVNRAILFRHALKLINGNNISDTGGAGLGIPGLTIVAENPVYVQGDWNSNDAGVSDFNGTHAATSIIADAVTLLSNSWTDTISFTKPYAPGNRNRNTQTWYRLAIIGGKGRAFPQPAGTPTDFGTDGGAHNFLRYLENGDQAVNYQGATATFFYNRQAVGTYKCCNTVYGAPTRNYAFDIDFLNPALLPPNTPVFRDINAVGFSQELRPGR